MTEQWKPISLCDGAFAGRYEVSDAGRVRSLVRGKPKILKANVSKGGYCYVRLTQKGKKCSYQAIARLVAHEFIGECPDGKEVNHKSRDKLDNSVGNLEYLTPEENQRHYRESCGHAYLSDGQVRDCLISLENGETRQQAAKRMGISPNLIGSWLSEGRRKNVVSERLEATGMTIEEYRRLTSHELNRRLSQAQKQEIVRLVKAGESPLDVALKMSCSEDTVRRMAINAGHCFSRFGHSTKDYAPLTEADKAEIVRLRLSGLSAEEVAAKVSRSTASVVRAFREAGYVNKPRLNLTAERRAEIVAARDSGMTFHALAAKFDLSVGSIVRICKRGVKSDQPIIRAGETQSDDFGGRRVKSDQPESGAKPYQPKLYQPPNWRQFSL